MWYLSWHRGTVLSTKAHSGFPQPITILLLFHIHSSVSRDMDNGPLGAVVPKRLPTARQAHNGTSLTVGTSGTWFLYVLIQSQLDYGCARDPEEVSSPETRANQIHTNRAKTQNTTTI